MGYLNDGLFFSVRNASNEVVIISLNPKFRKNCFDHSIGSSYFDNKLDFSLVRFPENSYIQQSDCTLR
jgi:hypothetical protein